MQNSGAEGALQIPSIYRPMFLEHYRKVILGGGRGSAKSHTVARYCIIKAREKRRRILCTREFQKTIAESVHNLLSKCIEEMGYSDEFIITNSKIVHRYTGSEFIFAGIRTNVDEIKSMEGIDICWVEEAQNSTQNSLDILIPTIRQEGSQLIFTFNPFKDDDPVYIMATHPDEKTLVIWANYFDNPFFPEVLREEMEQCKRTDYDKYEWVWLGKCKGISAAQIFRGKYRKAEFDTPPDVQFYYGADWGFANDPVAINRSFILGNTLYIDYEAGGVGVELDELPGLFATVPGAVMHPIPSDNSRPETISYMKSKGYNIYGAEKWTGSVEDGIEYLRNFDEIVIHPRCPRTFEEFETYQYKVDRQTNEILRIPVDKYNHWIDGLRYAHVSRMRSETAGSVYHAFNASCVVAPFEVTSGTVFTGTLASPGRVLTCSVVYSGGAFYIVNDYAMNGELAYERVMQNFSPRCEHVWFPMLPPEEVNAAMCQRVSDLGVEPSLGEVFPVETEGTELVNRLFAGRSLKVFNDCHRVITGINERSYRMNGELEAKKAITEPVLLCTLIEYTVWRAVGRLM